METIQIKAKLLFVLENKQQWINRVPQILPPKTRPSEKWIWIDKNGNVFEVGADFIAAEKIESYPCKVYRPLSVNEAMELQKSKS